MMESELEVAALVLASAVGLAVAWAGRLAKVRRVESARDERSRTV